MSNMAYCRFENTVTDLEDCMFHITDDDLSELDEKYRIQLVKWCKLIVEEDRAHERRKDRP